MRFVCNMDKKKVIQLIDYREVENIYSLKVDNTGMIVTTNGNVYIGTITNIDYCDDTITLTNGVSYKVTITGYVQTLFNEVTISESDVLCCMDKSQTWVIHTNN